MTRDEFNQKWADHIPKGWYGLEFDDPYLTKIFDETFSTVKERIPHFEIHQIKVKFLWGRVYLEPKDPWLDRVAKYLELRITRRLTEQSKKIA